MLQDYWINLNFVEKVRQPDGTGGFEYVYRIGEQFRGGAILSDTQEQMLASQRGENREQYTVSVYDNVALGENDVIMFVNENGKRVFLRLNADLRHTPEHSNQSEWKYGKATKIDPDLRVVN